MLQERLGDHALVKEHEIPDAYPQQTPLQENREQHITPVVAPEEQEQDPELLEGHGQTEEQEEQEEHEEQEERDDQEYLNKDSNKKYARNPWNHTLEALVVWKEKNGRWPVTITEDREEKMLGKWLANQRSYKKSMLSGVPQSSLKGMCEARVEQLDLKVPGWENNKGGKLQSEKRKVQRCSWEESLEKAKAWKAKHPDRWPVQQPVEGGDPSETVVYRWLIEQRRYKKNFDEGKVLKLGGMNHDRASKLDHDLPGWFRGNKDVPRATFSPKPVHEPEHHVEEHVNHNVDSHVEHNVEARVDHHVDSRVDDISIHLDPNELAALTDFGEDEAKKKNDFLSKDHHLG